MARWWNRSPQWDGLLLNYNGQTGPRICVQAVKSFNWRPLSSLGGEKKSNFAPATYDEQLRIYNVLVWNFSSDRRKSSLTSMAYRRKWLFAG